MGIAICRARSMGSVISGARGVALSVPRRTTEQLQGGELWMQSAAYPVMNMRPG